MPCIAAREQGMSLPSVDKQPESWGLAIFIVHSLLRYVEQIVADAAVVPATHALLHPFSWIHGHLASPTFPAFLCSEASPREPSVKWVSAEVRWTCALYSQQLSSLSLSSLCFLFLLGWEADVADKNHTLGCQSDTMEGTWVSSKAPHSLDCSPKHLDERLLVFLS